MLTELFDFNIPEELIAKYPSKERSDSKLLVYYKEKDLIIDSYTKNITDFLDDKYFLVFNNTKVIPARLKIKKISTDSDGELLLIKIIDENRIQVITDKSKKYKTGTKIKLPDNSICEVEKELDQFTKIVFCNKKIFNYEYFENYGQIPLPPYIKKEVPDIYDKERYQTIYNKYYGSVAAPTAGLHFDDKIFNSLNKKNINYAFISLNIGPGTFQPIYTKNIEDHKIHSEEYFIEKEQADKINNAIKNKKIIIPVGTTSLRTLESAFENNSVKYGNGVSNLYIYPPYNFKITDKLFTNFHTPKSTLAVLVSAIIGIDKLQEIYNYAISKKYRFFSYGDAMLIL